jgi:Uma2 family endonuclease
MTPAERDRVHAMLPSEPDVDFLPPSEGDRHWKAGTGARQTLSSFFRRTGRKVYISGNLAVYYPGERLFSPDVLAVLDVEPHDRNTWDVRREGKGLDLAIEIHVAGHRAKDLRANVERYARLGIHEYFVFDRGRLSLRGFRLPEGGGKRGRAYQPLVPQGGRLSSEVLGLDLTIEGETLRFYLGTAALLDADERLAKVETLANEAIARQEEQERAAQDRIEELERAAQDRIELERQLRAAREEIERLKGGG